MKNSISQDLLHIDGIMSLLLFLFLFLFFGRKNVFVTRVL